MARRSPTSIRPRRIPRSCGSGAARCRTTATPPSPGALGDSVYGWILKPPGFVASKKYPLVYLLHGGPQTAWLDVWHARWNYQMFAARGYVVVAVNRHGSTGYGQKFADAVSQHWGDYP